MKTEMKVFDISPVGKTHKIDQSVLDKLGKEGWIPVCYLPDTHAANLRLVLFWREKKKK